MNIYLIGTSNSVSANSYLQQLKITPNLNLLASCRMGDVNSSYFVIASDDIRLLHRLVGLDVILIDAFINDVLMHASGKLSETDLTTGYRELAHSISEAAPNVPVLFIDFRPPPLINTGKATRVQTLRDTIFSAASIHFSHVFIENDTENLWFNIPDILHYRLELSSVLSSRIIAIISSLTSNTNHSFSNNQNERGCSLIRPEPWSSGLYYNTLTTSTFSRIDNHSQVITDSESQLGIIFISTNNSSDYLVAEKGGEKLAFPTSTIYGRKLIRYLQFPDWFRQIKSSKLILYAIPFEKLDSSFRHQSIPNAPAIQSDNLRTNLEVEVVGIITDKTSKYFPYFFTQSTGSQVTEIFAKPSSISKNIYFDSFWAGFNPKADPIFGGLLGELADIQYVTKPEDADLIICSWASGAEKPADRHRFLKRKFGRKMLYYTAEHNGAGLQGEKQINFDIYDFSLSHYRIDDVRHAWMPNYIRRYGINIFTKVNDLYTQNIDLPKTHNFQFCYSNPECDRRNRAFHIMSKLQSVDCGGKLFNSSNSFLPREFSSYLHALSKYRFIFAYENISYPSYHTEKLIHALMAGSIPLYWGDALIGQVWNRDCFIDLNLLPEEQIFQLIAKDPEKYFSKFRDINAIPCPNAHIIQNALQKKYTQVLNSFLHS